MLHQQGLDKRKDLYEAYINEVYTNYAHIYDRYYDTKSVYYFSSPMTE